MTASTKSLPARLAVTGVAESGAGLSEALIGGRPVRVFVPGALPGDEVEAEFLPQKKGAHSLEARVTGFIRRSPDRRPAPFCPLYDRCGGCPLAALDYEAQRRLKRRNLEALFRAGGVPVPPIRPVMPSLETPSRNKAVLRFGGKPGALSLGLFAQGTHDIVRGTERCPQCPGWMAEAAAAVLRIANELRLPAWDEAAGQGLLRSLLFRDAGKGGRLACLVASEPLGQEAEAAIARALRQAGATAASVSLLSEKTNRAMGCAPIPLFGDGFVTASICGLSFRVRPETFLQINAAMTPKLYSAALDMAEIRPEDTVLDLYCGVGTLSLLAAKRASRVIGVEIVPASIEEARANAAENGIGNAEFFCGPTEEVLPSLAKDGIRPRAVIVDPPRKGLEKTVPAVIAGIAPETVVYIACGPAALVRDCEAFAKLGYRLEEVLPVDLFPETLHVESVAKLVRA